MNTDRILLGHGSGGTLMHDLVEQVIGPALRAETRDDGARVALPEGDGREMIVTTDSYVVSPLVFPGGSIGHLAIHGTINDVAMMGAEPAGITVGFILEEGLPMDLLRRVLSDMADAAGAAGVGIVAGDTKVVERGKADGLFVNTSGYGFRRIGTDISGSSARAGDAVIVSGPVGDHGTAVMGERAGLSFEPPILSDTAPLNRLVTAMLRAAPDGAVHVLRDPTRGGLATTLCEIASSSGVSVRVEEHRIPVRDGVRGACDLLGLDPLYVANEGRLVAFVEDGAAAAVIDAMRDVPEGEGAGVIGHVVDGAPGRVVLETLAGGTRVLFMLQGEQLPRIC